jgi:hypothetical protein
VKAWLVHALFAAMLFGSLLVRQAAPDASVGNDNLEPAVFQLAQSYGWKFRGYQVVADTGRRALVFEVPSCADPLWIIIRLVTMEEEPFTEPIARQRYIRRYLYMNSSWDTPPRFIVAIQRIKYTALAILGRTRYSPAWELLQVDMPLDCAAAARVEWRKVWYKDPERVFQPHNPVR